MGKKATKQTISEQTVESEPQKKFSKSDLLKSVVFTQIEADFLGACLNEEVYTLEEAKQVLIKLRKEMVK